MRRWRGRLRRAGIASLATSAILFSTLFGTCAPLDEPAGSATPGVPADVPSAAAAPAADSASPASPAPPAAPARPPAVAAPARVVAAPAVALPGAAQPDATPAALALARRSPAPQPAYADLSHPTFTASGPLAARFVAPAGGSVQTTAAARVVVATGAGGGVELAVNGAVVPFANIGSRSIDAQTGATSYEYFGVKLVPGPNALVAVPLGAGGARGAAVESTLFGPGKPVRAVAAVEGGLVADGRSRAILRVRAYDAWGHPALPGSIVRVAVVSGDAALGGSVRAADLALQPGGTAEVPLVPGLVPNPVLLRVTAGDAAEELTVAVRPALRPLFVTGLATVGVGSVPGSQDGAGLDDGGGSRRGRLGGFASGALGRSGLTVAYESANRLTPSSASGPFVDDRREAPYDEVGDSSVGRDDLRSRDHLFVRLDTPRASLGWGEFQARTGPADGLGGYTQPLSGAHVALRSDGRAPGLELFSAKNDVAYARRVVPVSGLGTLQTVLDPDIVVGSESVSLASLDRRTGAVVLQTLLVRDADYALDYASGALRFLSLPLPLDARFNPQVVVVQYQYAGPHVRSRTSGGRLELPLRGGARLGIGYVDDATGSGNFSLFQQDLSGGGDGVRWSLAHAASRGDVGADRSAPGGGASGQALRGKLTATRGPFHLSAEYDDTTAGFANPFGGLATPGLQNYRLALARIVPEHSEITLALDGQRNRGPLAGDAQRSASLHLRRTVSRRFSLGAGVDARSHAGAALGAGAGSSVQAQLSGDYKLARGAAVSLARTATVGGGEDPSQPAQTALQVNLDLPHAGKAYLRELWSAAPTLSFASATAGLTGSAQATRSLMIGLQQPLGPATTVDSGYVIDRAAGGTTAYGVMGLRERLQLSSRLTAEGFLQQAAGGAGAFSVGGLQVAYGNGAGLHASAGLQTRGGAGAGTTAALRATGALSSEVSLLGDLELSRSPLVSTGSARLGLAVRPAENGRHVTLLSLERGLGTPQSGDGHSDVLSLDHLVRAARTDFSLRLAYKLDGDGYYTARSALVDLRAVRALTRRFDVGAEARTLSTAGIAGARTSSFAAEAGYKLGGAFRLAAGHNFSASADPSLTGKPVRRGFYATLTTVLDRLFDRRAR